jgi:hypothetical protein
MAWVLLALAGIASADSLERNGFEVHYSAVPSVSLAPQVAKQYAITRSANRALLNVVVLQAGVAVKAVVSGSATNLSGQRQELAVREVREGEAIYYLAEPRTTDRETLDFDLSVTPEGGVPIDVKFRQEFFVER